MFCSYVAAKTLPSFLSIHHPEIKVLFIVRDPVERMMSHLAFKYSNITWEDARQYVMTPSLQPNQFNVDPFSIFIKMSSYYGY